MKIYLVIALLLIQCGLIVYALRILWTMIFLIVYRKKTLPFVPSSTPIVRLMVQSGYIHSGDTVVDLGCGTGTLCVGIARRARGVQCVGVEQEALLATVARIRALRFGKRVDIQRGDFFDYPLSNASVVVGFWVTELMPQIMDKVVRECAQGTIIMSHMFPLPAHEHIEEVAQLRKRKHIVYVYRVA